MIEKMRLEQQMEKERIEKLLLDRLKEEQEEEKLKNVCNLNFLSKKTHIFVNLHL